MIIPDSVVKSIPSKPIDNNFIYCAMDMWERIEEISEGKVKFQNFDMALLANCMELFYKGLLQSSGLKVSEHLMNNSHSLYTLHNEIENRIMSLSGTMTIQERRDYNNFLKDLSDMYISTRYSYEQSSLEEFQKCVIWARNQRDIIMNTLDPTKEWKTRFIKETNNLPKPGIYTTQTFQGVEHDFN